MPACAYPDCTEDAADMLPACMTHWRLVPGALRRRLNEARVRFAKDPFDQRARDDYNAAHRAAAESLIDQHSTLNQA
jgi:hypothetical protein